MSASQFWQLGHLSNQEISFGLERMVKDVRRSTGELIAYLGEVEDRRLHLLAACGSMFEFCVERLGFSEDEACRRIEAARLARRFPALFPPLAAGKLSLSVLALLKPHLNAGNVEELLAGVSDMSVRKAREFLAARFPSEDVPSTVRKLSERLASPAALEFGAPKSDPTPTPAPGTTSASNAHAQPSLSEPSIEPPRSSPNVGSLPMERPRADRLTPLSSERYAIRFTASKELKNKLELSRDLLRHASPRGDFAPVIERALDLLLADLSKRRFGGGRSGVRRTNSGEPASTKQPDAAGSRHIGNAARRVVAARDGIQCSWTDQTGRRCSSRAWLEYDHRQPFGRSGPSTPDNLRLLCRAHNRLAAEQAYGRAHMAHAMRKPPQSVRDSRQAWWSATHRSQRQATPEAPKLRERSSAERFTRLLEAINPRRRGSRGGQVHATRGSVSPGQGATLARWSRGECGRTRGLAGTRGASRLLQRISCAARTNG